MSEVESEKQHALLHDSLNPPVMLCVCVCVWVCEAHSHHRVWLI